jgi:site-specific DNA-adenine methylase
MNNALLSAHFRFADFRTLIELVSTCAFIRIDPPYSVAYACH